MSSDTQKALSELFAGRYEVGEPSSWGGTALMYEAVSLEAVGLAEGTKVVLATVPVDCSVEEEAALVLEVLGHIAEIQEEGLVPIVDFGVLHDVPFVAYKWIDAEPLFTTIEAGAVEPEDVLNLGYELIAVTASAHAAGVWHGDLTPRNIIAGADGIFVVGLGIQLLVQQRDGQPQDPGKYTTRFRAPEVEQQRADFASDQVSIAQVLRYAATGREPHGKIRGYHFDSYTGLGEWIKKAIDDPERRRFDDIQEAQFAFREIKLRGEQPEEPIEKSASAPPVVPETPSPDTSSPDTSRLPLMLAIAAVVGLAWFLWPRSEPAADVTDASETAESREDAPEGDHPPEAAPEVDRETATATRERADETAPPEAPAEPVVADARLEGEVVDGRFIPTAPASVNYAAIANRSQGPLQETLPDLLETTMDRIARNDTFEQRTDVRPLLRYAREHRSDVRTHLVLARLFMHLGWYKSALERYRSAVHQDASAAATDPRALSDLVRVIQSADDDEFLEGFGAIRAGWGRAALPYIQAEYPRTRGWKKRRAMVRLTRRLRAL